MAKLPFWEKLNEEQREKLRTNTSEHIVEKGQILYHGTCDCMGVMFVRKGGLRVFLLSEDGKEVTLYRLREGESCMLSASCVLESRMTQEQIAGYLGTAREVVSRMIKYFSEEGMVETFRGGVRILDIERLKGLCG